MSLVDVVVIVLALAFAFSGFRQGLLVSAASFLGFFGGAVVGAQLSGAVADSVDASPVARVFAALVVVLAGALLGQLLAAGETRTIEFEVTVPGEHPYECSFHVQLGQTGVMTVSG